MRTVNAGAFNAFGTAQALLDGRALRLSGGDSAPVWFNWIDESVLATQQVNPVALIPWHWPKGPFHGAAGRSAGQEAKILSAWKSTPR